ncbi:MAG: G5 domain-containing protein [Clostridia bacterium]|nr:G5 domain-containing protein [Clostridia bacterium]
MEEITKEKLNKTTKKYVALMLMGTIGMASIFSVGAFSRRVHVKVDDTEKTSVTVSNDTDKILDQMDIKLFDGDVVDRNEDQDIRISIKRACRVSVSKGDEKVSFVKAVETVGEAIKESGISVDENDEVNYPLNEKVFSGMNIEIHEIKRIKVFVDGQQREYTVPADLSVNEALNYLGINISSNDLINVDVSSNIYEGMEISINRVEIREVVKKEEIPFNTVYKTTHLLDGKGSQVSSTGKKGEKEVVVKETVVDGVVKESEEISSKVITEPVDEVVLKGTDDSDEKESSSESVAAFSSSSISRASNVLYGSATAYTAPSGSRTSQGNTPTSGVTIAVDPNKIPYGSHLEITDLNGKFICSGIAQDTGGALKNGSALVDIFMNSKSECLKFGRKKVKVYVK